MKWVLGILALLLLLVGSACGQSVNLLSPAEKQECQKPFHKVIELSEAHADSTIIRKELVEAGELFLNTCLRPDIPPDNQQLRLSDLKEFARVVPLPQDCRFHYVPTVQLADLDGDTRDEIILHTQILNCELLSLWGGNGTSIIYHQDNNTKIWSGTLIWPCLDAGCTSTTLWTQSPEPIVQNLPIQDSQGHKFTLIVGKYLGADHIGEILNIWRWNDGLPTIVNHIELDNWCGSFEGWDKWRVSSDGALILPETPATDRCEKRDALKYVLKGDQFEVEKP